MVIKANFEIRINDKEFYTKTFNDAIHLALKAMRNGYDVDVIECNTGEVVFASNIDGEIYVARRIEVLDFI